MQEFRTETAEQTGIPESELLVEENREDGALVLRAYKKDDDEQ